MRLFKHIILYLSTLFIKKFLNFSKLLTNRPKFIIISTERDEKFMDQNDKTKSQNSEAREILRNIPWDDIKDEKDLVEYVRKSLQKDNSTKETK